MLRKSLVGQSGKYFDHMHCLKRGQQIRFCLTNHFGKSHFPPFQQTAEDSNTTRFSYVSLLQLQETIKILIVYHNLAILLSLMSDTSSYFLNPRYIETQIYNLIHQSVVSCIKHSLWILFFYLSLFYINLVDPVSM